MNIIPVIGKADMLTKKELQRLKEEIVRQIQANHIQVFSPALDPDDEAYEENIKLAVSFS